MADESKDNEKLKKIVALLPKENCGKCGYENCGEFAVALVAGQASPTDCRKSLDRINEICEVLGIEVPEGAARLAEEHRKHHGHHEHGHHGRHSHHSHHGHHGRGH